LVGSSTNTPYNDVVNDLESEVIAGVRCHLFFVHDLPCDWTQVGEKDQPYESGLTETDIDNIKERSPVT
jgi:hypothetical protein